MKVLFFNHKIKNCGVYQYGFRLYNILKQTVNVNYIYVEIETYDDYISNINKHLHACEEVTSTYSGGQTDKYGLDAIIYNYHNVTMPWLNANTIQRKIKNIGIPHESSHNFFNIVCNVDPTILETKNVYSLPRPIYENVDVLLNNYQPSTNSIKEFIDYSEPNIPIFGSFGFGFKLKGFDKIVSLINKNYDNAIIKFVIPVAHFDQNNHTTNIDIKNICLRSNIKSTIKLMITHEFFSNEDILCFLNSNTINLFMYDKLEQRSISSVIDYAVSVNRPIGISDSCMFKHIYSDEICLYKTPIRECIKNHNVYFKKYVTIFSNENVINKFIKIYKDNKLYNT